MTRPETVALADLVTYDDILARTEGISRSYLRAMKARGQLVSVAGDLPVFLWSEAEPVLRAVEARAGAGSSTA